MTSVALALGEAREPQAARLEAGDLAQLALGLLEPRDHRVGVRQQGRAGIRQVRAVAGPREERHPDLAFERRHLLADRGLREVEGVGGSGEGTPAGNLAKDRIRFTSSISAPYQNVYNFLLRLSACAGTMDGQSTNRGVS